MEAFIIIQAVNVYILEQVEYWDPFTGKHFYVLDLDVLGPEFLGQRMNIKRGNLPAEQIWDTYVRQNQLKMKRNEKQIEYVMKM